MEASGQKNNPILINSSDDGSESSDGDFRDDDTNNFFHPNENNILNENPIQNNQQHHFIPPRIKLPIDHPIFPPPPPPQPPAHPMQQNFQLQALALANQQAHRLNFGFNEIFGNVRRLFLPNLQPPQRNAIEPIRGRFNFEINQLNDANGVFLGFNANNQPPPPPPPPPPPDNTKKKQIKLNGFDIEIIDVPHKVLTVLKKGCEVSPNFIMGRASSYIQMVLQHGEIPDDLLDRLVIAACDPKTSQLSSFTNDNQVVLRNFFPEYKISDLKKAFQMNKQLLLNTIDYLKKGNNFKKMLKVRQPDTTFTIIDPIVSVQLDELFAESEKERKKKEKEEEEERQIEQARADGSLIECECCICEYPIDWMIQCPEGHLMCKKCVERQIETAISEGRSNVPCLKFGGCEHNISMAELQRLIPKKTLERLVATETLNAITAAEIDHRVTCHKCGYIVIYDGDGPMNCPQCKAQTCPKCGGAWHPNMTCEQFKEIDKDRIVEEQMNEAVVRTCPNCKTQFMKDEGCNKMECPRCHTWICYWCRKIIPKEVGYEHFWRQQGPCPPDKCPLWVQNDTLHLIEAEKAKDQAKGDLQNGNLNENNEEEEDTK